MNTFILFWNPGISNYKLKDLQNALRKNCHVDNWAVWDYKEAHRGDRFFWVRCGEGKTGICMSGYFRSDPYLDEDWSGKGREVHYAKLMADVVIDPESCPILTTEELQKLIPSFDWTGGHSGRLLPDADAQKLEARWKQFLDEHQVLFEKYAYREEIDIDDFDWSIYDDYEEDDDFEDDENKGFVSLTEDGEFEVSGYWWENDEDEEMVVRNVDLEKAQADFEQHISQKKGEQVKINYSYEGVLNDERFEKAALLAVRGHRGQVDKAGKPYIGHLIRVANWCPNEDAKIVGMLHDILEDTGVTVEMLKEQGFSNYIVDAIVALTRCENEDYETYIKRIADNPLARSVKICDLEDNMDVRRLTEFTQTDAERTARYLRAWHYLKETK